jgi:hypothetical protein
LIAISYVFDKKAHLLKNSVDCHPLLAIFSVRYPHKDAVGIILRAYATIPPPLETLLDELKETLTC